jgi:hypothetical protein
MISLSQRSRPVKPARIALPGIEEEEEDCSRPGVAARPARHSTTFRFTLFMPYTTEKFEEPEKPLQMPADFESPRTKKQNRKNCKEVFLAKAGVNHEIHEIHERKPRIPPWRDGSENASVKSLLCG